MDFETFRRVLTNFSTSVDGQPIPSAHKNAKKAPLESDNDGSPDSEAWWVANPKPAAALNPRTRAFLLAYIAACGECIPARGIRLTDGWVHPDRGIMKAMLMGRLFTFEASANAVFVLSETGRDFLFPKL